MTQVLIAFGDTGGGHRAAARALEDALGVESTDTVVQLVDPYNASGRWPFNRLSGAYAQVIGEASWLWQAGFHATNNRWVTAAAQAAAWPVLRAAFQALRQEGPPDVIVSTHSLLSSPLRRVFPDVPMVVVVTDLVSGHASWYERSADLLVTPTEAARVQALARGIDPSRVAVLGLPIAPAFDVPPQDRAIAAQALGWDPSQPTILLMGGGDGVGPIEEIAVELDAARLPCQLAIVTGRNAQLRSRLAARAWNGPVHVYGFVGNMPQMMRAASALITKAGPGTICESFAAGCPLVLFGAIPGQESGNVRLVCESGAGVWAPTPEAVRLAIRAWFDGDQAEQARYAASRGAAAAARPAAATDIARRILSLASSGRRHDVGPLPLARR